MLTLADITHIFMPALCVAVLGGFRVFGLKAWNQAWRKPLSLKIEKKTPTQLNKSSTGDIGKPGLTSGRLTRDHNNYLGIYMFEYAFFPQGTARSYTMGL